MFTDPRICANPFIARALAVIQLVHSIRAIVQVVRARVKDSIE